MSFSLIWESESQVIQTGDDSIEAIQAGTDAQVLQMTEDAQPVMDGTAEIDKVVQGVGQLGQVKQFVDSQVAQGGMSEQTAQLAQIHVESICNALRYPSKSSPIPACENFGSSGSRLQSTRLASEGIADRAMTMFEAVKKFFKMTIGKAVDVWSGLWNNAMLLEKRLDMMEKKVKDLKGAPGSDQIECKGALKLLGQKSFDASAVSGSIEAVNVALGTIEDSTAFIAKANDSLSKMLKGEKVPLTATFMRVEAGKLGAKSFEGDVGKSVIMPGGRVAVFTITNTEEVGSLSISIEREEMKDVTEKMQPLDKAAMITVLKSAREIFTQLKKKKEAASQLKKLGSDVESAINSSLNAAKNKPNNLEGDAAKEYETMASKAMDSVKSAYISIGNYCTKMATLSPVMSGEIIRGVLDIVGKSASGFKEA